MAWKVQNLLAVVFTPPTTTAADAFALWSKVTGASPDAFNRHAPGSTASGMFQSDNLSVTTQPGRVDIAIAPPDGDAARPPIFDDFVAPLSRLKSYGQAVAKEENPIRVALVANCVKLMATEADAVASFAESTHLPELPSHATDLNFAMNIRRKLGSAGWEMNRVLRWGTGKFQMVQFAMGAGSMQVPQVQTVQDLATFLVDVNSVARGSLPIGGKQAVSAFDEFEAEVKKLILGGYDALTAV